MRIYSKVLSIIFGFTLFSLPAAAVCNGPSVGVDVGWERLHSHTKLEVELPSGFGTYEKKVDREGELQLANIEGEAPIACRDYGSVSLGLSGVFQLGQGNGKMDDVLDDTKKNDVTIGTIASGPKGCLGFSTKTSLCLGLLVRASGIKVGKDFSTTGGTLSPMFGVEQVIGDHFRLRAEAAFAATETRLKESLQDYNQTDYTLGVGWVFNK